MAKAEQDGVIDVDGIPRRIKAGQEIPEGATVRPSEGPTQGRARQPVETREPAGAQRASEQPEQGAEQRPEGTRPDQRAKGQAPENREKPR